MKFNNLARLMEHFVEEGYAPGNTVKVYYKNDLVFDYSCGYSDIKKEIRMTGEEYFNLYSCSKVTTVTAALQLIDKGLILLNDPLYEYIPEYKEMYIKNGNGELVRAKNDIKILNLFNMTAGLTYNTKTENVERARVLTNGRMDTDVVVRCIAGDPLSFEPGERFQYSLCHDVLAGLVSIVTGKKFRDYVKENIFDPLGMESSVYHMTPREEARMASQYKFVPYSDLDKDFDAVKAQSSGCSRDGIYENVGVGNYLVVGDEYDSGGAGIISNVGDYAKLMAALAGYGMGINGERILSKGAVELMRTNTLSEEQLKPFSWKQLRGYGYGLGVRTMMDPIKGSSTGNVGEFGWGGAAGASVYVDPEIGLAAVYAKHTLNPREDYYQPRVRNAIYSCL